LRRLAERGLQLARAGDHAHVFRTIYLAELTTNGATLHAQARALADWFVETVERSGQPKRPSRPPQAELKVPRSSVPTAAGWRRLLVDPGERWEAA
jgi:hypothetical protein